MMKKHIIAPLIIILLSSCTRPRPQKIISSLEGQKWSFAREITTGVGSGDSWTFLPDNRFIGTNWYSGGAYWTHHFSGTYHYDAERKTVFLKYDKNKISHLKKSLKQQLNLKISENDTILIVTDGWKNSREVLPNFDQKQLRSPNVTMEKYVFKIEHIKF